MSVTGRDVEEEANVSMEEEGGVPDEGEEALDDIRLGTSRCPD